MSYFMKYINRKEQVERMYTFLIFAVTIGGFVFAGSWDNALRSVEISEQNNNQYCLAEDTNSDDYKVEARKRGGKGNRGRRRGGGGLR